LETLIGRSLAMCVHPYAVWRSRSLSGRVLVLSAYLMVGYAFALSVLLLSS